MRRSAIPITMISILASSLIAATAYAQEPAAPAGSTTPSTGTPSGDASGTVGVGAAATTDYPAGAPAPAADEKPKPKPPPYSPPWKLRGVAAATAIVSDTQFAKYESQAAPNGESYGGLSIVETVLGSYKITPEFAALIRLGVVQDSAPSAPNATVTMSGAAFMNPVIGGTYGMKFNDFRLNFFLGFALPVLSGGGGDNPNVFARNARRQGPYARAAMDNAMFAVNDFVVFPGVGFAYVKNGLTVQVEVTVLELLRVKGDGVGTNAAGAPTPGVLEQPEKVKTNLTSGLHIGYFVMPMLSLGAELHYQRWLNAPIAIEQAEDLKDKGTTLNRAQVIAEASRDQMSVEIGPRFHFKIGEKSWIRPGIAYERGIDRPMAATGSGAGANYHNIQIHIPVSF